MSENKDLTKGRDKLAERYVKHGDPRTGERPTSEKAHQHAAETARQIEREKNQKG